MLLLLYRRNRRPKRPSSLKIYEAHVGMSGEDEAVSTYAQFRDEVLPRIKKQGYTAIQLMAIQVRLEPGTWCSFFCFGGWACWLHINRSLSSSRAGQWPKQW